MPIAVAAVFFHGRGDADSVLSHFSSAPRLRVSPGSRGPLLAAIGGHGSHAETRRRGGRQRQHPSENGSGPGDPQRDKRARMVLARRRVDFDDVVAIREGREIEVEFEGAVARR